MDWFDTLTWSWIGIGILTFLVLVIFKIRAPYGRHTSTNWGKLIDNKWGWFFMEMPALLIFPLMTILGPVEKNLFDWVLVGLWLTHYINRTLIYPFRLRTKGKKIPLVIVINALFFNAMNGFLNGYFVGFMGHDDPGLLSLHALLGLSLFFLGMYLNMGTDNRLISLRKNNSGYQVPQGWLFKYISCPNHLGEIVEWAGFALVAWNLPALSFAIWTICNLVPRALNHHAWYKEHFSDYPEDRKAVLPFLI